MKEAVKKVIDTLPQEDFHRAFQKLLEQLKCIAAGVLCFDLLTRPKMPFQGDAPEGGDTFEWQLWEEIAWAEIGWWNGTS